MLTIYDWFGYELLTKDRYRLIKEAGFDGVLLWWSNYLGRNDYHSGPQLARDAGLFVENIHTPFQVQDDLWVDNLNGEATIDCYLQCVSDCAEFNIPTMVVHLPDDDKPHTVLGLDRIKRLAERAEQLNVSVALENLNNTTNLAYILQNVPSNCIGFCYDCCHHYRYCPDDDLLSTYSSRLKALHLHDYDENTIHKLPFDGVTDWSTTMQNIVKAGYTGAIAIEAMNWSYQDMHAKDFLCKAFNSAKQLELLTV